MKAGRREPIRFIVLVHTSTSVTDAHDQLAACFLSTWPIFSLIVEARMGPPCGPNLISDHGYFLPRQAPAPPECPHPKIQRTCLALGVAVGVSIPHVPAPSCRSRWHLLGEGTVAAGRGRHDRQAGTWLPAAASNSSRGLELSSYGRKRQVLRIRRDELDRWQRGRPRHAQVNEMLAAGCRIGEVRLAMPSRAIRRCHQAEDRSQCVLTTHDSCGACTQRPNMKGNHANKSNNL